MPDREEQRRRNRERMPGTAAILDEFRAVFGPGVKLRYAEENGHVVGKPGPRGVPFYRLMNAEERKRFEAMGIRFPND